MDTQASMTFWIIIPKKRVRKSTVLDGNLREVTEQAGGVTVSKVRGEWLDDYGKWHYDRSLKFEWRYFEKAIPKHWLGEQHRALIDAVLASGELSVLSSYGMHYNNTSGVRHDR